MATGTGNLPNQGMSFSPFAILTAEEMNDLVENINSLADGSGIGDGSIGASDLNLTYSTSEHLTGRTWIDGKPIYRKVVTGLVYTAGTTVNTNHGISIETPISVTGFTVGNTTYPLYFSSTTFISVRMNLTQISTSVGSGVGNGTLTAIIEYTKV